MIGEKVQGLANAMIEADRSGDCEKWVSQGVQLVRLHKHHDLGLTRIAVSPATRDRLADHLQGIMSKAGVEHFRGVFDRNRMTLCGLPIEVDDELPETCITIG
jgi:hypothetical protein